jgi:hypothetical protein
MKGTRWPRFDRAREVAWVKEQQVIMPASVVRKHKLALAERIRKTRKIFGRKLLIGDVHSHTTFSDGISTLTEVKDMAKASGLDFIYITDHRTLRQRRYCCEKEGVWCGQEPPSVGYEVCLLNPKQLFVPRCRNYAEDFQRARKSAPFVFVTHPMGYPGMKVSKETVSSLWTLGERFSMEVLNGHDRLTRAYDEYNEKAVRLWERLLEDGKQVNVVGGSDAHISFSVGTAWTGVYGTGLNSERTAIALEKGHGFASEAPLVWLGCGRAIMGDVISKPKGTKVRIDFAAADSAGLHSVRLIRNGRIVANIAARDSQKVEEVYEHKIIKGTYYFRLECTAGDQRRAFSSPLYITADPS